MRYSHATTITSIGFFFCFFVLPAAAQTPAEKIRDLNSKITAYSDQVAQKNAEGKSLQTLIDVLNIEISQTEAELEKTTLEITQTQDDSIQTDLEITTAQQLVDEKTAQLKILIQELHTLDHKTFLELFFSTTTLADLFKQIQYTENVQTNIHTIVAQTKELKLQLEQKRVEQITRKTDLYRKQQDQQTYQATLAGKKAAQEELLTHVTEAEAYYRSLVESEKSALAQLESTPVTPDKHGPLPSDTSFIWPIDSRIITCGFHCANYPLDWPHNGADIATPKGTPVHAIASGYTLRAVWDGTTNLAWVKIEHTNSISSEYLHLSIVSVEPGQYVNQGDIIGYSGGVRGDIGTGVGLSTGPHLHLAIYQNLVAVDPLSFLP